MASDEHPPLDLSQHEQPCPYCGEPALIVYDWFQADDGPVETTINAVACSNRECPGPSR